MNKLLAFTLISATLLLGAAGSVQAQGGDSYEIRQIKVIGLRFLDESAVLSALTIKQGDVLVGNLQGKLNAAAESLKRSGWFTVEPELTLDPLDVGVVLNVRVEENPRYNSTRIIGNTLLSSERLLQEIDGKATADGQVSSAKLVRGEVINVKKLVAGIEGMLRVYADAGYVAAAVTGYDFALADEPENGLLAGDVTVRISEGLIDEVLIVGLEETKENIAYGRITHLEPDQILTRSDLDRDINQLYNTGLFERVTPELQPSLREGYAKVVINVEEAETGQVGFGLGYSTVNGIQGSVNYNEKNLFGTGKQLASTLTISDRKPSFDVTYTDRYFTDDSFWSLGLYSVHSKQQRYPGTAYESELNVDTKGLTAGYGKKINDYDTWQVSAGVADYDYDIVKGDPFRGYSPRQRARLSASGETRKLVGAFTHDTRDNVFSTTEGVYGQVTGELAGFGGDFAFNKWTAEGREFTEVGSGNTLALRQRIGLATGEVPIYEEYRYGGVMSVRGVEEDQVFGTHSLLSNVELRRRMNDTFTLAAFLDNAWAGESFGAMDHTAGAGVGARIKLGFLGNQQIRLDYGFGLAGEGEGARGSRFHFYFGEMF